MVTSLSYISLSMGLCRSLKVNHLVMILFSCPNLNTHLAVPVRFNLAGPARRAWSRPIASQGTYSLDQNWSSRGLSAR
ncbi:hypothetical protein CENSYa_1466 [Cenarchaeum symbiosum A]|uniref:Uncharacterized protein n=1 Tax=Cenarchaeum symbiosum (strain A) TaxID=414004 RepID=A0RXM1_CENSY|nr:hypothetical protein CENSYa_1466 [Cenarchaeum symbiosum A]